MTDRHARLTALAVIAIATLSTAACATMELTPEEIRSVGIADLRARAGQGDLTAQVALGDIYAEGDGVPQDDAEAMRWYRLVAEQGNAEAQLALGGMYFSGRGVEDAAEGVRWWRLAAEQGHLPAQTGLGGRYFDGRGVAQDEAEAVRWYRLAAEQGDEEVLAWLLVTAEQGSIEAQVNLAEMYSVMIGEVRDASEAVRWHRLVAEQGHAEAVAWLLQAAKRGDSEAQLGLGVMYERGRGVTQDDAEAVRWYRLATDQGSTGTMLGIRRIAEQGNAEAQLVLGGMYFSGKGVAQDTREALRWYRQAAEQGTAEATAWVRRMAEQGNVAAQVNLGVMYEGGRGVTEDKVEAMAWYRRAVEEGSEEAVTWIREAANQGWAEAQVILADVYASGQGVVQDTREALRWYRLATDQGSTGTMFGIRRMAEQGSAEAQHGLGVMYAEGRGVAQDEAEAVRWYRQAAEQGHADAQFTLGSMYLDGRGVAQDEAEAVRWYLLAAKQEHLAAQVALGSMYAEGRGMAADASEAERLYLLAAKQGSPEAQRALMGIYANGCGVADDPFSTPIATGHRAIEVGIVEFATIPNSDGTAARMMLLVDEPGTGRLFVNDMRGPLYSVSYNGVTVTQYLDLNEHDWGIPVISSWSEQGFQSFAFHSQFNDSGTPGFGKFYTLTDTSDTRPPADFTSGGDINSHDTVLLEWTAEHPEAVTYDGGPPRELVRYEQPVGNHNGGHLAFNPIASPGDAEFGLLYMGAADGGDGGDPLNLAQNLGSAFGKILRLDPLGSNSANGEYGIPADNPFANDGDADTLGEIYTLGVRNPQRFNWDSATGNMFVADIGQESVEEVSLVTAGANLGWNNWEGSFGFFGTQGVVSLANQRGDAQMTYPVVEYGQLDPLLQPASAVTGVYVYRATAIPQLANLVLFGDNPSGEVFGFSADNLPAGGQEAIRRILFNQGDGPKTLLQLIQKKNIAQGKEPATRADLRLGLGPNDQVFVLNKHDGTIRLLVPEGTALP